MGDALAHGDAVRCLLALLYLTVFLPLPLHPDDLDDDDDAPPSSEGEE